MRLCYLHLILFHIGLAAQWQVADSQTAFTIDQVVLTLLPGNEVTAGSNVTLRCEAKVSHSLSQPLTHTFSFLLDDEVVYSKNISHSVVDHNLAPVRVSNSGRYRCTVRIYNKFRESNAQTLMVTGLQTPMLKVKSDIVSEGEDVIATCSALEETGSLMFYFYEDNQQIRRVPSSSSNSVTETFKMQKAKEIHLQCAYMVIMQPGAGFSNKSNMWKIIVKDLEGITPQIQISPNENIIEGDQVKIQCQVRALSGLEVFLTKGSTVLYKSHAAFTHHLTARAEDSGDYVCKAEKGSVQKMATQRLSVAELFSKPVLRITPDEVFEGDRFRLTCNSAVISTQKITKADIKYVLLKEDRHISSAAIYDDTASSATNGNYSCLAMAKRINKTSLPLVFKAKVPVSAPIIKAVSNVIVGRPFKVSCKAENGTLPITYTLLRGKNPVAEMRVMETGHSALFNITPITNPQEIGSFKCQANNRKSSFTASASLIATVIVPVSNPVLTAAPTLTEGSDLYLTCSVLEGTEPITFSWYHNGFKIPSSTRVVKLPHSTHIVKAIERDQRGSYYCEATNRASETRKSNPVTIGVSLAVWKKALIGVLCILLLVAIVTVLVIFLRKMSKPHRNKQANELSVKPRPKSGDPMRMSLTLDIEDNTALNGTPCVMGRNVWSEHVSGSESDHSEEESELLHPQEVDSSREVPVNKETEADYSDQCTDVQVSASGVVEQPEGAALEYAQLNNSDQEPA